MNHKHQPQQRPARGSANAGAQLQAAHGAGARRLGHLLIGGALLAALYASISPAQAQYVWVNDKGLKEYSDRAPPTSVPLKRILKAPNLAQLKKQGDGTAPEAPPAGDARPPAGDTPPKGPKPPPTLAEREADYVKRKKDAAEKEQKAGDEAKDKAAKAANCEELRKSKRSMESGDRVSEVDKNGERSFLNDAERAARARKAETAMADCQ